MLFPIFGSERSDSKWNSTVRLLNEKCLLLFCWLLCCPVKSRLFPDNCFCPWSPEHISKQQGQQWKYSLVLVLIGLQHQAYCSSSATAHTSPLFLILIQVLVFLSFSFYYTHLILVLQLQISPFRINNGLSFLIMEGLERCKTFFFFHWVNIDIKCNNKTAQNQRQFPFLLRYCWWRDLLRSLQT